jgi:hypothetical protein
MVWEYRFDESYPNPGAVDDVIARFVHEANRPISSAEIRAINAGQKNPFRADDSLQATWKPVDASRWIIPDRPVPVAYLDLLRWSDGGEFRTGERWFQFFPCLDTQQGVRALMLAYHLPQYRPGAMPIALDGCGIFYLFDMRKPAIDGEYPIVCARAGNLGWEPDSSVTVANSFVAACRGQVSLDSLFNGPG